MNGIELDRDEFATIVLLLSASRVFGLAEVVPADPTAREAAFNSGLAKLRARGLVTGDAPRQAIPDTGLMRLASIVVDPRLVIVAERTTGGGAALHFADDMGYVSLEGDAASGYRLGWLDGTPLLARRDLRFLGVDPNITAHVEGLAVAETAFSGARELARNGGAQVSASALRTAGVSEAAALLLAGALAAEAGGSVLVIRLNAGQAEAARRAWVLPVGAQGGWIAWRPMADDTTLRFEPLTADRLAEILERFAQYLAPANV